MKEQAVHYKAVFGRIPREKRNRILSVATQEFAEKGLAGANINHIAETAGVSVGSMYKYFETKSDLYLEVVRRGMDLIVSGLTPIIDAEISLEEKIDAILDALIRGVQDHPQMNRLYCRYTAEAEGEPAKKLSSIMETYTATVYAALLRQAMDEGHIYTVEDERFVAFCMDNLFLTLQFSLSRGYWADRMAVYLGDDIQERTQELQENVAAFLKRALGLRP